MLQVHDLTKRYGARAVFRQVSFEMCSGTTAAIIGANGAGKSTLLRIVAGLLQPSAGKVEWEALEMQRGFFAPDAPIYRELTVLENLQFFARVQPEPVDLDKQLQHFQLHSRRHDLAGDLSSGWRARLQLAVATMGEPRVLLLDEPSAHLDEDGLGLLHDLLDRQRERGIALVATNDSREAARCDRAIEL